VTKFGLYNEQTHNRKTWTPTFFFVFSIFTDSRLLEDLIRAGLDSEEIMGVRNLPEPPSDKAK
jgi:hypothetical protein